MKKNAQRSTIEQFVVRYMDPSYCCFFSRELGPVDSVEAVLLCAGHFCWNCMNELAATTRFLATLLLFLLNRKKMHS